MSKIYLIITGLLFSFSLSAMQRFHSSIEDATWHVHSSPIYCELVHNIEHYGNGRFVFSSGGELAFQLHVKELSRRESVASLYSVAPFWRKNNVEELAQLTLSKGEMPIYIGGDLAYRMLYGLQKGRDPTFHYKDWADYKDDVYVAVSSVNFHQKIDEFKQCLSDALPYGSDHVKDERVLFAINKSIVPERQKAKLAEMILFAKFDKGMKLEINGHTDGRGRRRYNKKLSIRRTDAVREYLLAMGVPETQISLASYGETRPIASNRSVEGRKSNRRVDVVIKHE